MPNRETPGEDELSQEELQLLIHQQTLDALRGIEDLIEQHQNPDLPEEPAEQAADSAQKLYLRWKKGGVGEEEE